MSNTIKLENISKNIHMSEVMTKKLLDIFYTSTNDTLQKMKIAINKKDYDQIFRAAHTIKGSASNLLFDDLAKTATEIELAAKKEEKLDYDKKFLELKHILINTKLV